jgi:thermostable 8-oxoguanine DNA glycosylase
MSYTKKFDFRRQLKNMTLESLKSLKEYHIDYMLRYLGLNDKEASKHSRYVGYIDVAIKKKENK